MGEEREEGEKRRKRGEREERRERWACKRDKIDSLPAKRLWSERLRREGEHEEEEEIHK